MHGCGWVVATVHSTPFLHSPHGRPAAAHLGRLQGGSQTPNQRPAINIDRAFFHVCLDPAGSR